MIKSVLSHYRKKLDILCVIFILILAPFGLYIFYKSPISPLPLLYSLAALFGSIIYLILKHDNYNYILPIRHPIDKTKKIGSLFSIGYYISVSLAYVALLSSPVSSRSATYFGFVAIAAMCIAANIVTSPHKKHEIVIKISILAFLIHSSTNFFFSGAGTDYWTHLWMNEQLSKFGDIQVLNGKEPAFPIMHIAVSVSMILSGATAKIATILAVSIPSILSSIFVYLIGKKIFNLPTALFAMLLFTISNEVIYWIISPQTTTYGLLLIVMCTYTIVSLQKIDQHHIKQYFILLTILIPTLIITHAVSSFIMLIIVFGWVAAHILCQVINHKPLPGIKVKTFIMTIFVIGLIIYFSIAPYDAHNYAGASIFQKMITTLEDTLSSNHDVILFVAPTHPDITYTIHRFLDKVGLLLILTLFTTSIPTIFSHKYNDVNYISIITIASILTIISVAFPLIGSDNLVSGRWGASTAIFLSMGAAYSIYVLSEVINIKKILPIIMIIIIITCFFQISSNNINGDSPIVYYPSEVSPNIYSVTEKTAINTLIDISKETLFTDKRYSYLIDGRNMGERDYYVPDWTPQLTDTLSTNPHHEYNPNNILVWRNSMYSRPLELSSDTGITLDILGSEYYAIISHKYDKIYGILDVSAYIT